MSENEKSGDDFRDGQTKIFVPDRKSETGEENGFSANISSEADTSQSENSSNVRTPEQASADYVRHVQEERRTQSDQNTVSSQDTASSQGTVFCINCGTKNKAGSKFCVRCGRPLYQEPAAPQPSSYQNSGARPSYREGSNTGYRQNSGYGNSYQQGAGPQAFRQQYGNGPRYQPYQNRPAPGYYGNGQRYYGNGYGRSYGRSASSRETVMKFVFTGLICISLLFALFGRIVNKSAAMSLVTSGISSYLPGSLDDLIDEFGDSYSEVSDLYSDLSATVRYLRKSGYSSVDLAGMDRTIAKTAGSLNELLDLEGSLSDSGQDEKNAIEDLQRSANIGFLAELVLILVTAVFSAFSVYTVWKSKSTSKRRGVLCILAGINLVFMVIHLIIVGIVNSAFQNVILDVLGSQSLSSAYSGWDLGKVFNASVGGLLLPLIFTIAAIAADVTVGHFNAGRR